MIHYLLQVESKIRIQENLINKGKLNFYLFFKKFKALDYRVLTLDKVKILIVLVMTH